MKREEVLYLSSERQWIFDPDLAANPGMVLVTEELFPTTAPTVEAIVQAMVKRVRSSGTVRLLSVQCHGAAGELILWGGGLATSTPTQSTTTTSPGASEKVLVSHNVYKMAPFADCMHPAGWCELHACNVAAGADPTGIWCTPTGYGDDAPIPKPNTSNAGMNFLQSLANVLGVPVTAGVRVQTKMVGFDGRTFTATPTVS